MSIKKSDFGKGCVYNLGLFLAHSEKFLECLNLRLEDTIKDPKKIYSEMWFNTASDHLYELQIPEKYPDELKKKLTFLKYKCLHFGHEFNKPFPTMKDVSKMLNLAKEILMDIDKLNGVKVIKATWE